jgi:hypothetical protein
MREIATEIEIGASADRVWQILTDFPRFPEWNPLIRSVHGKAAEGAKLKILVESPGRKPMAFKPRVTRVVPGQEFRWLGRLIVPGVFDGEHIFEISPRGDDRVRFVHRECFSGVLVPILWKSMDVSTRRGFEAMNEALRKKAESEV